MRSDERPLQRSVKFRSQQGRTTLPNLTERMYDLTCDHQFCTESNTVSFVSITELPSVIQHLHFDIADHRHSERNKAQEGDTTTSYTIASFILS